MADLEARLRAALAGRYAIVREAGHGGMATVYLAEDLKHHRLVALKVLLPELAQALGAERFLHEITIAAQLSHPHILPLHDSGEADGLLYYVMPFVEGATLRDRLEREGPLSVEEAVAITRDIGGALAFAHGHGVVHRDVKPENVLFTSGQAVVSDFGIARLVDVAGGRRLTETGIAIGTPAYMSPEQSAGGAVDARSDVYSLGCVAYEMLGGHPPFGGPTPQAMMARHALDAVPPLRTIRPGVPEGVQHAIERALAKAPADRFATAAAFAAALAQGLTEPAPGTGRWRSVPRRTLALGGAALLLVSLGIGAVVARRAGARAPTVAGVRQLSWEDGVEGAPSVSADGRWIAYEHGGDIYLRSVGGSVAVNLTPGTPWFDGEPAFSPDGSHIAFSSRREGGQTAGGIWIVEVAGGAARRLADSGFAPAWSPDGGQLLATSEYLRFTTRVRTSRLWVVDVQSGTKRLLSEGDVARPAWSPHGHRIAYWRGFLPGRPAVQQDVWTMRPDGSDARPVTDDRPQDFSPAWSADGRYLYFCSGRQGSSNVWRVAIDERTGRVKGAPLPVHLPSRAILRIALAANDTQLVYESYDADANVRRVAFDREAAMVRGEPVAVTTGSREWEELDVAADGRVALAPIRDHPGVPPGIHVIAREGEAPAPLEVTPHPGRFPRWSPDGSHVAFYAGSSGTPETFIVRSDGTGLLQLTHFGTGGAGFFPQWSPDGSRILVATGVRYGGTMFLFDVATPWAQQHRDTLPSPPGSRDLRYRPWSWSPDGQLLAAYSEQGAGLAVYHFASRRWEVLTPSGEKPRWLSDSRRLVYADGGKLFLYDTRAGRSRQILAIPGYSLVADPGPRDQSLYFIARRETGDIWMAVVR